MLGQKHGSSFWSALELTKHLNPLFKWAEFMPQNLNVMSDILSDASAQYKGNETINNIQQQAKPLHLYISQI